MKREMICELGSILSPAERKQVGMIRDVSREEGKTPLYALSNPENLEGRWSTLASSAECLRLIERERLHYSS